MRYYINGLTSIWSLPVKVKDYLEATQSESVFEWRELFLVYKPSQKLEKYLTQFSNILMAGYSTEKNLMVDRQEFGDYVAVIVWRPKREKK